jgi:hypothetical protein
MTTDTIYFEAQTGLIRNTLLPRSNFYQYAVSSEDRPLLEQALAAAKMGPSGLEYTPEFLAELPELELRHRRRLFQRDRF